MDSKSRNCMSFGSSEMTSAAIASGQSAQNFPDSGQRKITYLFGNVPGMTVFQLRQRSAVPNCLKEGASSAMPAK